MPGPIAQLLAKGLKQAPQGIDSTAHSIDSFNELGKQVTDPLALAAHVSRGRLGYEAEEGNFQDLTDAELIKTAKFLDDARHLRDTNKQFQEVQRIFEKQRFHATPEDAIDVEDVLGQAIGQDQQRKLMAGSKIKLEKPIYVMRKEGVFSGQTSDKAETDKHTFSAVVIDPLKLETYASYTDGGGIDKPSGLPAVVYKLPAGTKVYHPAGKADKNEVVLTKKALHSAERAALRKDYVDAVKKGSPLFAAAGVAVGVNPDDANAQGGPSVDTELTTKVQGMLDNGVKASVVQQALAKKYQPDEIGQVMLSAMQPKIDELKAKGVPEETIMEAFRAKGISLPQAAPQKAPQAVEPATLDTAPAQGEQTALAGPDNSEALLNPSSPPNAEPQKPLEQALDGQPQAANDLLPNADGTQPGVDAPIKPYGIDVATNNPQEAISKLQNLNFTYEELGSSLAGWTGMAPGLKAKAEDMRNTANTVILHELQKRGIDAVGINKDGEIEVRGSDGQVTAYDDTFIDSMINSKYEVGGAVTGGIAGARVGAMAGSLAGPVGAVAGGVVGAAAGSAIGAFTGRGGDVLANARDLNYEVSTTELLAKMKDAGVADLTVGALGATALQAVKGTWKFGKYAGKGLARGYDLFIAGNKAGAQQTLKDVFNLNDAQAIDLVTKWEKLTNQKVLTEEARATGKLSAKDADAVMQAVTETVPGAENLVARARDESKTGGSLLSAKIDARAKDITREVSNLTNDNIDVVLQDKLGSYVSGTKDFFEQTKTLGTELMKDSSYRFDFSQTALVPAMREAVKGIHNSALRKDFYHYMQRISELGTGEAVAKVVAEKGIKPTTKSAVRQESAQATRIAKLEQTRAKKTALANLAKKRDTALTKAKALKTVKGRKAATERARAAYTDGKIALEKQHLAKLESINAKHADKTSKASVMPELKASDVEAAQPYRGFENLLELRKTINELRSDNRFSSFANTQQIKTALTSVDAEIQKAALEHMPEGKAWVKQWRAANTEYSKMKQLEHNALYKALTNVRVDPTTAVRAVTRSMAYTDPSTFMQVMGKLPTQTRKAVEGAVLKHLVEKNTVGFEAGKQALNFPALATDLEKVAMTQPEARAMKRTISEFANVFKNDPHLLAVTGNVPLPKFQSYLTADPVVRAKFEIASTMFNAVKSRIPFSNNAGRAALVKNLGRLLDNPKDAKATQEVLRALPNDPELKTALHQLAIQFTEKGVPDNYGKVPIYRVHKPGEANKAGNTSLGKGVLLYTDKAVAQSVAKQTGAKVKEVMQLHKTIATPEDVAKVLGREPTEVELKDPEVLQLLKNKEFAGIASGDKVLLFK